MYLIKRRDPNAIGIVEGNRSLRTQQERERECERTTNVCEMTKETRKNDTKRVVTGKVTFTKYIYIKKKLEFHNWNVRGQLFTVRCKLTISSPYRFCARARITGSYILRRNFIASKKRESYIRSRNFKENLSKVSFLSSRSSLQLLKNCSTFLLSVKGNNTLSEKVDAKENLFGEREMQISCARKCLVRFESLCGSQFLFPPRGISRTYVIKNGRSLGREGKGRALLFILRAVRPKLLLTETPTKCSSLSCSSRR